MDVSMQYIFRADGHTDVASNAMLVVRNIEEHTGPPPLAGKGCECLHMTKLDRIKINYMDGVTSPYFWIWTIQFERMAARLRPNIWKERQHTVETED